MPAGSPTCRHFLLNLTLDLALTLDLPHTLHMTREEIEQQITSRMPLEEFLKIQERVAILRKDEDMKLNALGELQKAYLAANTDEQREMVKDAVGQIREISRKTREEIRALNSKIYERMPLAEAKELYEKYLTAKIQSAPG
jgi:hypothetical protein